jgi:hypothetical protein
MPYRYDEDEEDVEVGWVRVEARGKKALLCRSVEGHECQLTGAKWIPFSQLRPHPVPRGKVMTDINEESQRGDEGDLYVTAWLAKQEEWG